MSEQPAVAFLAGNDETEKRCCVLAAADGWTAVAEEVPALGPIPWPPLPFPTVAMTDMESPLISAGLYPCLEHGSATRSET